jgi:hypothetical protein
MAKTIKVIRKAISGSKAGKVDPKPVPEAKAEPKKATPAPAPKTADKKERTGREVISGDLKITVLAKESPCRLGTTAHRTFALYKTGQTVSEWRTAVAGRDLDAGYLHADIRSGYISVK